MIPAPFDYDVAESVDHGLQLLGNGDAKLLAGGHSLIPALKLRIIRPGRLVDIGRLSELSYVRDAGAQIAIGALTRHHLVASAPLLQEHCPIVSRTAAGIGDPQVRHRGTIGGSLAHGDPASDLPAVILACEGSVTLQGADGQRTVPAAELFRDYMETAVGPAEVLTEVRLPTMDGWGFGYQKFNRRSEDWAMVAVSALVKQTGDVCEDVRIGLTNMGSVPLRAHAVEDALRGQSLSAESIARAAAQADEGSDPPADLNASSEYKRHLARVLCRRALAEAAGLT
jgi:aerobic carbon-monoxide dehydrogenase medium subunit